jgi:hypothetical protein
VDVKVKVKVKAAAIINSWIFECGRFSNSQAIGQPFVEETTSAACGYSKNIALNTLIRMVIF